MHHLVDAKRLLSPSGTMNIYRGCQHGCIYCDSRSVCYNMQHDFEDIEVKQNAPELLRAELSRRRSLCMVGTGSMADPYMPLEKQLGLTRRCFEIIELLGFGATLITKSADVLRDLELLKSINRRARCVVQMTLTTFDEKICKIVEPNVSPTSERFEALCRLREAGIETVVWLDPLLPFINDTLENLRGILRLCHEAGVSGIVCFGMGLTLRDGNREYFFKKLDEHFPGLKADYIRRYGLAYELDSPRSEQLYAEFKRLCGEYKFLADNRAVFEFIRRMPESPRQISLFD